MEIKKVICHTPEEFRTDVERQQKLGHAPIIRGRKLYVYSQVAAELKLSHGGYREGAGRPQGSRTVPLSVRISQEAMDNLNSKTDNKSEYIDKLLLQL